LRQDVACERPGAFAPSRFKVVPIDDESRFMDHESGFMGDESRFMADESGFMGDESRFMADESGFIDDESRFMADESGFIDDESRFMVDESGFMADESRFMADESGFMAHEPAFIDDESRFMADESGFIDDESRFMVHESGFIDDESRFMVHESGFMDDESRFTADEPPLCPQAGASSSPPLSSVGAPVFQQLCHRRPETQERPPRVHRLELFDLRPPVLSPETLKFERTVCKDSGDVSHLVVRWLSVRVEKDCRGFVRVLSREVLGMRGYERDQVLHDEGVGEGPREETARGPLLLRHPEPDESRDDRIVLGPIRLLELDELLGPDRRDRSARPRCEIAERESPRASERPREASDARRAAHHVHEDRGDRVSRTAGS